MGALNVKVADLAKVEQPFVKAGPKPHAPSVHVVGEVVDDLQAMTHRVAIDTL